MKRLNIAVIGSGIAGLSAAWLLSAQTQISVVELECAKRLYVSPFNAVEGRYRFHATPLGDELTLGVALRTDSGPVLEARSSGALDPHGRQLRIAAGTGSRRYGFVSGNRLG